VVVGVGIEPPPDLENREEAPADVAGVLVLAPPKTELTGFACDCSAGFPPNSEFPDEAGADSILLWGAAGFIPPNIPPDEVLLSPGFALGREDAGAAELPVFPNRLFEDAPVVGVVLEESPARFANNPPPADLPMLEKRLEGAAFAESVGGAPAGVVEFIAPKESGLAGVVAVLAPRVGALRFVDPNRDVLAPELAVLGKRPLGWEVGVPAAGALFPNTPPDGNAPEAVDVVFVAVDVGVELGFPKREPGVDAGLLAPPNIPPPEAGCELPPPNSVPPEAGCELVPPNKPPAPPAGVDVPEVGAVVAEAPPNKGFWSAGLAAALPNKLLPVPAEGVAALLLLPLPGFEPKGKPDPPAACPNRPDEAAGVDEPNSEPVAGAVEVVALLDWPAELLAALNVKDMMTSSSRAGSRSGMLC
jgi:hypothetical protein